MRSLSRTLAFDIPSLDIDVDSADPPPLAAPGRAGALAHLLFARLGRSCACAIMQGTLAVKADYLLAQCLLPTATAWAAPVGCGWEDSIKPTPLP